MGAMQTCLSVKGGAKRPSPAEEEMILQYKPLFELKRDLLSRLNITDGHFFSVFCTMRFRNSVRRSQGFLTAVDAVRKYQTGEADAGTHPVI